MLELAARADWLDAPHTFNEQERACLYGDVGGARALLKNSRYKQNRMQIEWNVGGDEIQLPANRTPAVCLLKVEYSRRFFKKPRCPSDTSDTSASVSPSLHSLQ